jgi:predicted ATPase
MAEAISLAKALDDMNALAVALMFAAHLAHYERNPTEVERLASELIELSTRHNFAFWLAQGGILRGWARCASGNTAEGISWIEDGIRDYRATGSMLRLPYFLALKAEALHLADRTSEALEAIKEAEALVERSEERWWSAEIHRLHGVFLAAVGADETQIEASFCAAAAVLYLFLCANSRAAPDQGLARGRPFELALRLGHYGNGLGPTQTPHRHFFRRPSKDLA